MVTNTLIVHVSVSWPHSHNSNIKDKAFQSGVLCNDTDGGIYRDMGSNVYVNSRLTYKQAYMGNQ
jgi:hypothetical protein